MIHISEINEQERIKIMSTKNDEMILQLKKKVEEQKAELAKLPRTLQAETSTVLRQDVDNLNLRVMSVEQLKLLKVKLHTYAMAAADLEIGIDEFTISGFSIDRYAVSLLRRS